MNDALTLRTFLLIVFSLLVALLLTIMPLPMWAQVFRPQWLPLVIIYWVIALPHRVGLGIAWIMGIMLDALYGSVLGEHALALAVLAYLAQKSYQQLRMFPVMQQALSVLVFIIIYQAILLWIQGALGLLVDVRWFWVTAFTSMIIWPWLYLLLRGLRKRSRVY